MERQSKERVDKKFILTDNSPWVVLWSSMAIVIQPSRIISRGDQAHAAKRNQAMVLET